MLPPQDAGPAIRDLKQTRPTGTEAKPGLGDAIHAVTLSDRRGPWRTRAVPPFGAVARDLRRDHFDRHNGLICAVAPLQIRNREQVADERETALRAPRS